MNEKLRQLAFWIDTNSRVRNTLILLQFIIAILFATLRIQFFQQYYSVIFWAIAILIAPTLCAYTISIFFYSKYGRNILIYDKKSGILFDKNSRFFNVALRCDTLSLILNAYPSSGTESKENFLKNIGEMVGRDFADKFTRTLKINQSDIKTNKDTILNLFEYDSSSGMGKFSLKECENDPISLASIEVINPCTGTDNRLLDNFIAGYLIGIFSNINKSSYTLKEIRRHNACPLPSLNITIEQTPPA